MVDAARNVPTMVWFNYRRVPAIAYARQLIDEGRIGTVFHYDAAYRQQWGADLSRAATWRMDPALAGSGVADDLLTHLLDTALYLNGPIKEGVAVTRTFAPNRKVDDAFVAILKFENGSVGTFYGDAIRDRRQERQHVSDARVERDAALQPGAAESSRVRRRDAAVHGAGPRDLLVTDLKHPIFGNFWRPGHIIGYEHTFIAALAEFLDCVARGVEFHPNFADGLEVQRVLDALQRSAKTREWCAV